MSNTESQVRYFNRYVCGLLNTGSHDFADKPRCINQHISYMLSRAQSMFEWSGLPDTIPVRSLELYLQTNGNVCFAKVNNDLYVFTGGLGGEPNPYYMPTIYTVANPALKLSKSYKIDTDCIVMPNDSLYLGLMPMFTRYATAITENELSMRISEINSRIINALSAGDDATCKSAEIFIQKMIDGEIGIIAENAFLDGLKSVPYSGTQGTGVMTDLIEMEQYLKASWFNELGLNANYNMKRESLSTAESQMNHDALLPLIDDMLKCRKQGIEKVNAMFGTSISVDYASAWKDNIDELEMAHALIDNSTESDGAEQDQTDTETKTKIENEVRTDDRPSETE